MLFRTNKKTVLESNGLSSVMPLGLVNGKTIFYCNYFSEFFEAIQEGGILVWVDFYCNGLLLKSGGTESVSLYRVRFKSTQCCADEWNEICIALSLIKHNAIDRYTA